MISEIYLFLAVH